MAVDVTAEAPVQDGHFVQFYEGDQSLVRLAGPFLAEGAHAGATLVVVATPGHWRALEAALHRAGVDVDAGRAAGTILCADAAELLGRFMVASGPDVGGFTDAVGGLLRRAVATGRPVRAFGEMVGLLWDRGEVGAAVRLEGLWNGLAAQLPLTLLCAYRLDASLDEADRSALADVCRTHAAVVGSSPLAAGGGSVKDAAGAAGSRAVSRSFSGSRDAAGRARRFVTATLRQWGRPDLVDDALLVVGELAANAVTHAGSAFTVDLSDRDDHVHISVRDFSVTRPVPRPPPPMATSGRGLGLVSAVSCRWGVDLLPDGKAVWAELGCRPAAVRGGPVPRYPRPAARRAG